MVSIELKTRFTGCVLKPFIFLRNFTSGYHTKEKNGTIRVVNGSDGYDYEKKDIDVVDVTDFKFTINLSDHILPEGEICTIPSKDDDDYDIKEGKDIKQVLEEYCKNNNRSKEIEMRKVRQTYIFKWD